MYMLSRMGAVGAAEALKAAISRLRDRANGL